MYIPSSFFVGFLLVVFSPFIFGLIFYFFKWLFSAEVLPCVLALSAIGAIYAGAKYSSAFADAVAYTMGWSMLAGILVLVFHKPIIYLLKKATPK